MFGYKTMSAYRLTGSGRTHLLFDMLLEMLRPITFGGLQWIRRLHSETTKRAIGNIGRKFIQDIQIVTFTQIADDSFQDTSDTFDAQAAWNTFATALFGEIATALHRPCDHTGIDG